MAYVCKVCGYVYEGARTSFEDLPDDWVCPLCGVGKDQFERTGNYLFFILSFLKPAYF